MNGSLRRLVTPVASMAAGMSSFCRSKCDECATKSNSKRAARPKLLFLGTGSSTGCPKPICAMLFQEEEENDDMEDNINNEKALLRKQFAPFCKVSNLAIQGDPKNNRNYRNNPSLLISHWNDDGRDLKNVVIDVGKTFREGTLRWFPIHKISSLDGIVLTHYHMDAVAGLDDVRGFQKLEGLKKLHETKSNRQLRRVPTPVYLSQHTLDEVSNQFPWLFPDINKPSDHDSTKPVVQRDVASFDVNLIHFFQPFEVAGLKMIPLPVWHGDDLICFGYAFSVKGATNTEGRYKTTNVVYLSDISRMMPDTLEYIQTQLPPTDILVVDALLVDRVHPVHYNMKQAIDLMEEIGAAQTYLVGMNCDGFLPHNEMNEEFARLGMNVQLAHDGLVLYL